MNLEFPEVLINSFRDLVHEKRDSVVVSKSPGRIEILGNHTDYNGGLVLTSTIDQFVWSLGIPSPETILHSIDYNETSRFNLDDLAVPTEIHWSDYAKGVFWAFHRRHHAVQGITGVVHGNLPQGSGLSSSAALEVSLVNLISHLYKLNILPKAKAMLAYEAERLFCGVSCGIMDQFATQLGKPNSLLGINCGNMLTQDVSIPENISFVVVNSMVKRSAGVILNKRRAECLEALSTLQESNWDIHSLSAVSTEDLLSVAEILNDNLMKRVTHVVKENQRVRDGIAAIKDNNPQSLGKIMIESHNSSRDLFEVSHPNLEILMTIATQQKDVIGCRLTGAGLGGNLLLLAKREMIENVVSEITNNYEQETGLEPETAICAIPGGVVVEDVSL
ncbi:MAG: galactokinase [Candidatus Thorarchaeota archaeon]|nr:galactokinase [Candidatus Thorarchaeota archaeon]